VVDKNGDPATLHESTCTGDSRIGFASRRALSASVAICLFVTLLPFGLIIALLIWLESPGAPIFLQERVGLDQRYFRMLKFRTMNDGCETFPAKRRDDERVTRLGRLLRRTSVDELPQLLNIVRGDMCFVGPRPELPGLLPQYQPEYFARFETLPGLTGLWQVSGRSDLSLEQKVQLDLEYAERRSLAFDLMILARTTGSVLSGRGAY
jgi:lipopolysaccharide/colanic/teichoic acid biosynthesis glycosyltransferase